MDRILLGAGSGANRTGRQAVLARLRLAAAGLARPWRPPWPSRARLPGGRHRAVELLHPGQRVQVGQELVQIGESWRISASERWTRLLELSGPALSGTCCSDWRSWRLARPWPRCHGTRPAAAAPGRRRARARRGRCRARARLARVSAGRGASMGVSAAQSRASWPGACDGSGAGCRARPRPLQVRRVGVEQRGQALVQQRGRRRHTGRRVAPALP